MIITRTPLRVSFFGGGTDLPEYFMNNGGAVIGSAIDKYIYHTVSSFPSRLFNYCMKISYSKIECVNNVSEIQHKPFREILRLMNIEKDVEIHLASDLPSFSGLGSSSAFTVGLLKALYQFKGIKITPIDLARHAIEIERNHLCEAVGYQDQTFASLGGINLIKFDKTGAMEVNPVIMTREREQKLSNSLLLFFTGITRSAQNIEKSKIQRISEIHNHLEKMHSHVERSFKLLIGQNSLDEFGCMLDETWSEKKMLSPHVSNYSIDKMYEIALANGALGGKILGAGGGGFILFYVPEEKQGSFREAMNAYAEVDFKLNANGADVIFQ